MFLKKIIKKNSWLLVSNLIISLILSSTRRGVDAIFFDFVPAIFVLFLLLPLVSGIILVLIQNKNRSYQFLPNLLIGSCLNNATIILVINSTEYFRHGYAYRQFIDIFEMSQLFLPLFAISVFGGLIGLVIRGTSEQIKKNPNSKITLAGKKIFGGIFLSIGTIGASIATMIFLVLVFHPSSSWLNMVMVDFKLIEVVGVILYYLLLLSVLSIVLVTLIFIIILGLMLFFSKKKFFNKKLFFRLIIYFFISLVIFLLLSSYTESEFELKKAEMKENKIEEHFNIKDFDNIHVSRFVEFDEIKIIQGDKFDIAVRGSQYDKIGLDFEKMDDKTLSIKRSELETYYNTDTWTMENRDALFPAGTKHLVIEITMPDIEKIEIEGGNIELTNFKVDNIEIKLNKRFNNIKGSIAVEDTLKLDAKGGIINLVGSSKNLIINSGDCWIEMDKFMVENAFISAINTSRLNVNVDNNMEIRTSENSGITNHNNK
ncbi:MAG: DUF2807 domain-containing protein [Candidatus Falkowbacteria bacterium]